VLTVESDSNAAKEGTISGRYLGSNLTSEAHFATIKAWIRDCRENHDSCMQTVSSRDRFGHDSSPLPIRCIEVLPNHNVPGDSGIRLRDTRGPRVVKTGAYISLTHRWNDKTEKSKTTFENLQARLQGKFGKLPLLFEDVFTIARRLHIKVVWIDSLCIIQEGDGKADWNLQADMMADYYQHSQLTIAGTFAETKGGILAPPEDNTLPWDTPLVRLPYLSQSDEPTGYFYVYKRKQTLVDEYWTQIRKSTVFQRAWILQEWLLSKRILWFTPQGLFFECHSQPPRTSSQEQISLDVAMPELRSHLQLKATFHFSNPSILNFWYYALEVYSTFGITHSSDRIPAVAGLAKEVANILATERGEERRSVIYCGGLWLQDIHRGLLWQMDPDDAPACTNKVGRVPSWSWASLMVPVKFPAAAKRIKCEMKMTEICLDAQDDPDGTNWHKMSGTRVLGQPPEGLFKSKNPSARLKILGKLQAVHIHGYIASKEKLEVAASATLYEPAPTGRQWRAVCSRSRDEVIIGWANLEREIPEQTGCADAGIAVLSLLVSTRYREVGLLLKRSEAVIDVLFLVEAGEQTGSYRRLGVGRIFDKEAIRDFHRPVEREVELV
jgi:hypothetical protein